MAKKAMNFSSKEAYRKWEACGHIHGIFEKAPGNQRVSIHNRMHRVKH